MPDNQITHWNHHAMQWRNVGQPLRPTPEDVAYLRERLAALFAHPAPPGPSRPLEGLLLGVTPELASVAWRPELHLLAIDQSRGMIDGVWPGDTPNRRAVRGDWFDLPIAPGTLDVVLGDGCFNALLFPGQYRELVASVRQTLRPGGLFALRMFCRPQADEPVDGVFDAAEAGRIGNFHVFKWRLVMALQGADTARGVTLSEVWEAFRHRVPDPPAWAAARGWAAREVATIDGYRGSSGVYSFPSQDEMARLFGDEMAVVERWHGRYEMAERCPHFLLRRR
jgi:SAM-dependent methyltransferase